MASMSSRVSGIKKSNLDNTDLAQNKAKADEIKSIRQDLSFLYAINEIINMNAAKMPLPKSKISASNSWNEDPLPLLPAPSSVAEKANVEPLTRFIEKIMHIAVRLKFVFIYFLR